MITRPCYKNTLLIIPHRDIMSTKTHRIAKFMAIFITNVNV